MLKTQFMLNITHLNRVNMSCKPRKGGQSTFTLSVKDIDEQVSALQKRFDKINM